MFGTTTSEYFVQSSTANILKHEVEHFITGTHKCEGFFHQILYLYYIASTHPLCKNIFVKKKKSAEKMLVLWKDEGFYCPTLCICVGLMVNFPAQNKLSGNVNRCVGCLFVVCVLLAYIFFSFVGCWIWFTVKTIYLWVPHHHAIFLRQEVNVQTTLENVFLAIAFVCGTRPRYASILSIVPGIQN